MRHPRTNCPPFLIFILLASACGDPGPPAPAVIETDSLGIALRTYGHAPEHLLTWTLDPEPALAIGTLDGGGPDAFGRISGLEIRADGGVVVSDALAGEVRWFSPSGEHLATAGGLGEGPGEFSNAFSLLQVSGDSVWAWDPRQQRVSVFEGDAFVDSWGTSDEVRLSSATLRGSTVFGQSNARLTTLPATGMSRPPTAFATFDRDGHSSPLFEVDGHERFLDIQQSNGQITGVNVFQPPFARGPFIGAIPSPRGVRVIGGPNDRFVLREWTAEGRLRAIHRYPALDRAVTEAMVVRARERIRERFEEPTAQMRQQLETLEANIPEYLPAFDRVWNDDVGRLWVRRSSLDRVEEWLVLTLDDLSPVARVVLPGGFTLLDIRGDLLGGYWLDEFDVSHVHVYRLRDLT